MMQHPSTETLDWVNPNDFNLIDCSIDSLAIDCFFEISFDYHHELRDMQNDYILLG